jgi:ATP-dependent Clp protease adaptor protein ClpS
MSTQTNTAETVRVAYPSRYNVVVHNDNETPIVFVVQLLIELFDHTMERARDITMNVHEQGRGIAGTYSREIAEQKLIDAKLVIASNGYPLKLTMERVD